MKVFLLHVNIYKWKGEDPNKRNFVSLHSPMVNFSDFAPSLEALDGRTLNTFFLLQNLNMDMNLKVPHLR